MTTQRPNFIFIVADDLGFADLGCYGGADAVFGRVSPVLDGLAQHGLRFTQGYSNSPVCSPTRFALMTARYQYRLRGAAEEPINSRSLGNPVLGLPPSHPTLPSLLHASGYRTALLGKWHLGFPPHFGPLKSGYEEALGPLSGGVDYFTHCASSGVHDLWENDREIHSDEYFTDLISRRSVQYVQRMARQERPFFLSMHYTAPHWPWETRDDRAAALGDVKARGIYHLHGGSVGTYQRMVHHMDEGIGWVVDALRETGQLDNTLIVFTSDNGGERFSNNWPLVGGKMDLTEGGIRVPYIAHWPAVIAPGGSSTQHCLTMDWSATMLEASGVAPHPDYPLDGVSLLRVLREPGHDFARPMYWRMKHRDQRAWRDGDWKYLKVDQYEYLFNIEQDARERANLAPLQPDRLQALRAAWQAHDATMPAVPADAAVGVVYGPADMPQR